MEESTGSKMDSLIKIGFENFKVFRERILFDIVPFTIFTGPNNSGKSTVLDGISLLVNAASSKFGLDRFSVQYGHRDQTSIHVCNNASKNNVTSFITGIKALIPLEEISDENLTGVKFRMYGYDIERTYICNDAIANLKRINFFRDISNFQEFMSIEILSNNKAKFSFNLKEYLSINGSILSEFLDDNSSTRMFENKRILEQTIYSAIFENTEIEHIENDNRNADQIIFKIRYNSSSETTIRIMKSDIKMKDGIVPFSEYINIYRLFLNRLLLEDGQIQLELKSNRPEISQKYYLIHPKDFIKSSVIQSFFDCRMFLMKLIQLENNPYYLNETSYLKVIRTSASRLTSISKEEDTFQSLLSQCKVWQDQNNSRQYKYFTIFLEYFNLGKSFKVLKNKKSGLWELWILQENGTDVNILDFGFGTKQLIPILLHIIFLHDTDSRQRYPIMISEPEANLHPNLQTRFADFLAVLYEYVPYNFLMETHSEYMIRRFQVHVLERKIKSEEIKIYYLSRNNDSVSSKKIEILRDGNLSDDFGPGFLDEADNLAIDLFNIRKTSQN